MRAKFIIAVTLAIAATPVAAQTARSISASDKAQGAKANPQLLAEFGGAYAGSQTAYVERVGKRVAVQSGLSNSQNDFVVTLLDSSVENAFAIPGGYVYVTRQLLALMNSEGELASVLGHEIGHVAARHSNKRNTRSTVTGIGAAILSAVTGSDLVGQLAGTGARLYTLSFSRSQEYEADRLGVNYISAAGYDPFAAASMLTQLNAETALTARIAGRDAKALPSWASTHPNGADRIARARQLAQGTRRTTPAASVGAQDTAFLRMLDGLVYDDNPAQGIVDGQTFSHPGLRLRFTAPAGYTIANGTDAVTVAGQGGQAQFRTAAATGDLPAFIAARFAALGGASTGDVRTGRAANADYAWSTTRAYADGRAVDFTIVAYRFTDATHYFSLITAAGTGIGVFQSLIDSVTSLSAKDAGAIRGKRIRIVTVKPGDTIEGLARQMAYPTYQRERFLTLNGLPDNTPLVPGRLVKVVASGGP